MNRDDSSYGRLVNIALGAWLFLSAFLWPHTTAQLFNATIVGALIMLVAYLGTRAPMVRFFNTGLAVWLMVSAYVLPMLEWGTVANSGLVAISVFIMSFVGSYERHAPTPRGT